MLFPFDDEKIILLYLKNLPAEDIPAFHKNQFQELSRLLAHLLNFALPFLDDFILLYYG